jgi:hypothetical protein
MILQAQLHVTVPIKRPAHLLSTRERCAWLEDHYMFDLPMWQHDFPGFQLIESDRGFYWLAASFTLNNPNEGKRMRQISRPAYMDERVDLPLADLISRHRLEPLHPTFDKADAQLSLLVPSLASLDTLALARFAQLDGDDDPQIAHQLHFLENRFAQQSTLFISGWETRSFATVTENDGYYRDIHLPHVATLYTLLFSWFKQFGNVPSTQMMPRLLGNLWRSTESRATDWNASLIQTKELSS